MHRLYLISHIHSFYWPWSSTSVYIYYYWEFYSYTFVVCKCICTPLRPPSKWSSARWSSNHRVLVETFFCVAQITHKKFTSSARQCSMNAQQVCSTSARPSSARPLACWPLWCTSISYWYQHSIVHNEIVDSIFFIWTIVVKSDFSPVKPVL